MTYKDTFEDFLMNDAEDAIVSSTKASWNGSSYSVELFQDGMYRVLYSGNIGNLYDSDGIILRIPTLSEDEWSEDGCHFYDNAIDALKDTFEEAIVVHQ